MEWAHSPSIVPFRLPPSAFRLQLGGCGVDQDVLLGAYIFLLAIFLGVELIGRVPATLHTPLMSGTNAIHGIVLLGGMIVLGQADSWWLQLIGFLAVILGAANAFGGFVVTDRMLEMFKRRPAPGAGSAGKASRTGQAGQGQGQ
jgi:proton-translocating NAD(P)+ transhydrogenase subunit alpha